MRSRLLHLPTLWPALCRLRPIIGSVALGFAGCTGSDVSVTAPGTDATQLFATLRLDKHIVTLSTTAPYDTAQLVVVPFTLAGTPMEGLPTPTFTSSDTTRVRVTADGRLTALSTGTDIKVIARLAIAGNVARADTTYVDVVPNDTPPRLASISMTAVAPDSMILPMPYPSNVWDFVWYFVPRFNGWDGVGGRTFPTITAIDSNGNPVSGLRVEVAALDPDVGLIFTGLSEPPTLLHAIANVGDAPRVQPILAGPARFVVRTTAYGVTIADTATWQIIWPTLASMRFGAGGAGRPSGGEPAFVPASLIVGPSVVIDFYNYTADTVKVTFEDPSQITSPPSDVCQVYIDDPFWTNYSIGPNYDANPHCGVGDMVIPPAPDLTNQYPTYSWTVQTRQFSVPGNYLYHTNNGSSGQITVTTSTTGTFP